MSHNKVTKLGSLLPRKFTISDLSVGAIFTFENRENYYIKTDRKNCLNDEAIIVLLKSGMAFTNANNKEAVPLDDGTVLQIVAGHTE